jgi:hypothetical protein
MKCGTPFFEAVEKCAFRIRAIVVKKALIYSPHLRSDKEAFYSFFVRSMLSFDGGLLQGATVIIDGSGITHLNVSSRRTSGSD